MSEPFAATQDEPPRPRRSWLGFLLGAAFVFVGGVVTVMVAIDFLQGVATYSWEETTCTIERSEVIERPDYDDFEFVVTYHYYYRGEELRSSDYGHYYTGSSDLSEAHRLANRYAEGESVPCYFDPDEPGAAYLRRANLWHGFTIFLPLVFVGVGVFAVKVATGGLAGRRVSVKEGKKNATVMGGMFFLFGAFFLMGFGMLIPFFVMPALKVVEARSWEAVPCTIVESGVRTHSGDDGSTYSIEALYRYDYEGREYRSNRYRFMSGSSSGYDSKARQVELIPAGATVECWVNPDDPFDAVIDRGFGADYLFGLIPLIFGMIGAGGLFFVWKFMRDSRRSAAAPSWTGPPVVESPVAGFRDGPIDLDPKFGPIGKLGLALFFSLFWNGIVSLFVWQLISEWRTGDFDWLLALFLTPFVLIGLLLLSSIPYSVMALVNPRPRLRISSGVLHPGESAQIDWSFRGAAGRIRKLRIWLEAVETTTTTTSTSTSVSVSSRSETVREIEVAERGEGLPASFGSATFTLPRDALRTTTGDSDKSMGWKLRLHGTIDYWPDVSEEYPLEVVGEGGNL